ncbi:hypothetical protein KEM55_002884, partial [Ascosphaera atra]
MEDYNKGRGLNHHIMAPETAMVQSNSSASCSSDSDHSYPTPGNQHYGPLPTPLGNYSPMQLFSYGQRHPMHAPLSTYSSQDSLSSQTQQQTFPPASYDFSSHYVPGYLNLPPHNTPRVSSFEDELEEQDTTDDKLLVSERPLLPLKDFPDVEEFDRIIQ